MSAEATYSSFAGGTCLSTGALRQYIDGTLPRQNLHLVEKHLLDCDFCSGILEDLDVSENALPDIQRIAANVNSRISDMIGMAPQLSFWARFGSYFKAGSAAVILIGAFVAYHYASSSPPPDLPQKVLVPSPVEQPAPVVSAVASEKTEAKEVFPVHPAVPVGAAPDQKAPLAPSAKDVPVETGLQQADVTPDNSLVKAEMNTVPVVKKEEVVPETPAEKEIISNLQIVNVKVLQKMTKTATGSRKPGKKGQLSVPSADKKTASYLPEDMPLFPNGDEAMEEYLANAFKNPVKDKRALTGKAVGVMFTVSARGKISEAEITHSISPELDVEILRLINSMPQWIPGKHLTGDITCVLALTVK
jgi:hypothetical protein